MSNDAYYFSHDYNARNDPKLIKLLMNNGVDGIGIYWNLVEMLYEQDGFLMLSECESYAFAMRTECEKVRSVIDSNLFKKDTEKFWSESVLKRLEKRKLKSIKASKSASKRWNNANAMRTHSERNAKKGKERKEKNINIPFNSFWNLYNKKIGSKKKCEKKWSSLNDEEREKIIHTLPKFLESISDKQFQPYPQTYLNNERWNDEVPDPKYEPIRYFDGN